MKLSELILLLTFSLENDGDAELRAACTSEMLGGKVGERWGLHISRTPDILTFHVGKPDQGYDVPEETIWLVPEVST
jgi:hypothetical protein